MRIAILLNPHLVRRWQSILITRLQASGHEIFARLATDAAPLPSGYLLLEQFEETIFGRSRPLGGRLEPEAIKAFVVDPDAGADLMIDLAGGQVSPLSGFCLRLRIEGMAPEAGLASALIDRRAPWVWLDLIRDGRATTIACGLPAVPDANVVIRAQETVAARIISLTEQAIDRLQRDDFGEAVIEPMPGPGVSLVGMARFGLAGLTEKIGLRLKRLAAERDQWVVGWRQVTGDAVIDTLQWPAGGYHWLPDDGKRYYADPFLHMHDGQPFLFVEEFVYEIGRGHLSVARWTGSGWTTPEPVLERPYHLSWPRVFARDGHIWMLPETSEAKTLELYCAVDFPARWELAAVLATDISLADATVLERDDGWWMMAATVDLAGASSWDGLALLRADDPLKDWRLIGAGPALIDARAARPAGEIVRRGDTFLRPVQDCTLSYGSGLGIARIDRLDESRYVQTLLARLAPDPAWNAIGAHTLNMAGGIEVIDINRGFDIRRNPPHR